MCVCVCVGGCSYVQTELSLSRLPSISQINMDNPRHFPPPPASQRDQRHLKGKPTWMYVDHINPAGLLGLRKETNCPNRICCLVQVYIYYIYILHTYTSNSKHSDMITSSFLQVIRVALFQADMGASKATRLPVNKHIDLLLLSSFAQHP